METRLLHFVAVLIVSLCVSASCKAESNSRLSDNGDKQAVEQILNLCKEELRKEVGVAETFLYQALTDVYFSVFSNSALLDKRSTDKANNHLSSQAVKEFLDCVRQENYFSTSYSCRVIQSKLLSRCPELVHKWSIVPRRYLRHKSRRHKKRPKQKDPANRDFSVRRKPPAPSPPRPSKPIVPLPKTVNQVPARTPSPVSPSHSTKQLPAQSPKRPKVASPPENGSPPPELQNGPPPPELQNIVTKQEMSPPSHKPQHTLIIASAVGCAVAVFALVAFLLFRFFKKKKNNGDQKDRNRDDNPLLYVYSSDFSAGSSQKSQTVEISSKKNFKPSSASNNSLAAAGKLGSFGSKGGTTVAEASRDTPTNLPTPPGKEAPPPPQAPLPPPVKHPAPSPPPPCPPPKLSPLGPNRNRAAPIGDSDGKKAKMKPFFWDKVQANSDHTMVWNDIKSGSFQFNEELMESLFGYAPTDPGKKKMNPEAGPSYIQIVDPKKATNLAILLKALNVTTRECCDALNEGNELPAELIQTLIKMAPSPDEELKLRLFDGDVTQLGPAERFLKEIIEIPFAFKRLESILFMSTLQEELASTKESFATLEVACKDLKNSRLFMKLLEAVLKTGNRMNDGTYRGGANAFRLDTLLKVSDVKGTDGKTTLLHFVVQEIIRSEGVRAARRLKEKQSPSSMKSEDLVEDCTHEKEDYHRGLGLQVISGVSDELDSVKKAAVIDGDNLRSTVSKIGNSLVKAKKFLQAELKNLEEDSEFRNTLATFVEHTEGEVEALLEEENRITTLAKSTGDYFHGSSTRDEGLRLFVIVRDFLIILDKVCKEVKAETKVLTKTPRDEKLTALPQQESSAESRPDLQKKLFPAIQNLRAPDDDDDDFSSSDDER